MDVPSTYNTALLINEKVLYVLSLLKKATVDEVAMEIMELDGISSEEGLAEMTIEIGEALEKLHDEGTVTFVTTQEKKVKYFIKNM